MTTLKMARSLILLMTLAVPQMALAAEPVNIYVGGYSYIVDGVRSEDFRSFETRLRSIDSAQIEISVCPCADAKRVTDLVRWLAQFNFGPPTVTSITSEAPNECADCN